MGTFNETVRTANSAARTGLMALLMAAAGFGGWKAYSLYNEPNQRLIEQQQELDSLTGQLSTARADLLASTERADRLATEVELKKAAIAKLEMSMGLLKLRHRVARLHVVSQKTDETTGRVRTTVEFSEVDEEGKPLAKEPQTFEIDGDQVYVECLVVKFDDKYIEQNALDRNTAICLFQRIFGEHQEPIDGYAIDQQGSVPASYRRYGETSEFEKRIWADFWTIASDPGKAKELGIRAAHADAPSTRVREGVTYELDLRTTGEFTLWPLREGDEVESAPAGQPTL